MDIFKLTPTYYPSTTFKRKKEDTIIWTERFLEAGDFLIKTVDDTSIINTFPKGTLVSHTDTKEVMMVETHHISRDKDKKIITEVSGRSVESFAENRVTRWTNLPLYDSVTEEQYVETIAAMPAETIAQDLLRWALQNGYADSDDEISNLIITSSIRVLDSPLEQVIQRGDVYSRVLELLRVSNAGIKTVRPNGAQTTLNFVIHDGLDKTNSVVFSTQNGDLEDAEYLWSIRNLKNYAQVSTHIDSRLHRHRALGSDVFGWNRRIMYVEADDLEGDYSPGTTTDVVAGRAQTNLDEHQEISLISAKVTEKAKPKFKIHYDVGDLITARGEFDSSAVFRVTEHILTVDKDGARGFPSLSVI